MSFILLSSVNAATINTEPAFRDNFYDVAIQGRRIWIVGYHGTILHSRDRGHSWTVQRSGTSEALFRISFVSPDLGWVSGSYGTILHTTDGGENWHTQSTPTEEHLLGLTFLDSNLGWAVGDRGTVLHTQNGGRAWVDLSLNDDVILNDIFFVDLGEGWIVGEFGRIYHTQDGGQSWLRESSPIEVSFISGENRNLFRLLLNARNDGRGLREGLAFGLDGVILKTGGTGQWKIVHKNGTTKRTATSYHLFDAAISQGKKWAVGERGTVIFKEVEGSSWTPAMLDVPPVGLNGIAFGSDGLGLIVGNRGTLLRTEDRGETWERMRAEPRTFLEDAGKLR